MDVLQRLKIGINRDYFTFFLVIERKIYYFEVGLQK